MIVPTNNMTIRFTDDKISRILRVGVDRDVLRNMRNHIIVMKDVPFGIANRILNVTNIDVNLPKDPKENWVEIICGDEETLKNIYYGNVTPKSEPSVVITEEPKIDESVMVETPVEEEVLKSIQDEVVEDELETVEENVRSEPEVVEAEEVSENTTPEDDESSDETMEDEEPTENVESAEEVDTASGEVIEEEAKPVEPVQVVRPVENMRRQVNVNNNRHRKHH